MRENKRARVIGFAGQRRDAETGQWYDVSVRLDDYVVLDGSGVVVSVEDQQREHLLWEYQERVRGEYGTHREMRLILR